MVCNDVGYKNEETSKIYKDLEGMRQQKRDAEIKIKNLREEIDQASRDILENYQESINKELKNFGVEFSINGVKRKSDNSRKEGVDFNIFLKGESFNPRGSGDSPYKISNTLSAGDKSTLAFAFFVAKHQGKDISNQILIFDDPITSLDFFRKTQTKNKILKLQEHGAQVIVLTHSNEFAKLFDKIKEGSTTKRFIKIQKNNIYSGLSCTLYNKLSDMIISKHDRYRNLISRYIVDPSSVDRSEVMTSIRPYVETEIKQCMVDIRETSLGKMIERLRNENISEEFIENLEHINEVSTPVHHGSAKKRANDYEHITDDELNNLCKNAININYNPLQPLTRDFVNSQNQTP